MDGLAFSDDNCSSVSSESSRLPLLIDALWWLLLLELYWWPLELLCCECCWYWWLGEPDFPFCSMWLMIVSSWWCWMCFSLGWLGDDGDDAFADEWICASKRSIGTFNVWAAARAPDDKVDAFDCACKDFKYENYVIVFVSCNNFENNKPALAMPMPCMYAYNYTLLCAAKCVCAMCVLWYAYQDVTGQRWGLDLSLAIISHI